MYKYLRKILFESQEQDRKSCEGAADFKHCEELSTGKCKWLAPLMLSATNFVLKKDFKVWISDLFGFRRLDGTVLIAISWVRKIQRNAG